MRWSLSFEYGSNRQGVSGDDGLEPGGQPDGSYFLWLFLCLLIASGMGPDEKEIL